MKLACSFVPSLSPTLPNTPLSCFAFLLTLSPPYSLAVSVSPSQLHIAALASCDDDEADGDEIKALLSQLRHAQAQKSEQKRKRIAHMTEQCFDSLTENVKTQSSQLAKQRCVQDASVSACLLSQHFALLLKEGITRLGMNLNHKSKLETRCHVEILLVS